MNDFLICLLVIIIGWVSGFYINETIKAKALQDCAKQHNVYACEYVAVPKKGE